MTYYERKLPHWQPEGFALFVTWRLHGSLPSRILKDLKYEKAGKRFVDADLILDTTNSGPLWLQDRQIARLVVDAILFGESDLRLYQRIAYVVMANRVHILVIPHTSLARITRAIKGYTSREAKQVLGRTGKPFWQDESIDRWVRNEEELRRIQRYIEYNPVRAGMVKRIEDWPWSGAHGRVSRNEKTVGTGILACPLSPQANQRPCRCAAPTGRNACRHFTVASLNSRNFLLTD